MKFFLFATQREALDNKTFSPHAGVKKAKKIEMFADCNPYVKEKIETETCHLILGQIDYWKTCSGEYRPQFDSLNAQWHFASEKTIDKILTQNGQPLIYTSRHQLRNLEREVLAVVLVVTRRPNFLLEKKFTLETEEKPLQYIICASDQLTHVIMSNLPRRVTILISCDFFLQNCDWRKDWPF